MAQPKAPLDTEGWTYDFSGPGVVAITPEGQRIPLGTPDNQPLMDEEGAPDPTSLAPAPEPTTDPADKFTLLTQEGEIDPDSLGPTLEEESGKGKRQARRQARKDKREDSREARAARKAMESASEDPFAPFRDTAIGHGASDELKQLRRDQYLKQPFERPGRDKEISDSADEYDKMKRFAEQAELDRPKNEATAAQLDERLTAERADDDAKAAETRRWVDRHEAGRSDERQEAKAEDADVNRQVFDEVAGRGEERAREEFDFDQAYESLKRELAARRDERTGEEAGREDSFRSEVEDQQLAEAGASDEEQAKQANFISDIDSLSRADAGEAEEESAREANFQSEIEGQQRAESAEQAGGSDRLAEAEAMLEELLPGQSPDAEFDPEWDVRKKDIVAKTLANREMLGYRAVSAILEKVGLTSPELRDMRLGQYLDRVRAADDIADANEGNKKIDEILSLMKQESDRPSHFEQARRAAAANMKNTPER